jgi:hypothetical protein
MEYQETSPYETDLMETLQSARGPFCGKSDVQALVEFSDEPVIDLCN